MLVAAASLALFSTTAATADSRNEALQATPHAVSDMSDADVLAERHLALYRVSRAAVLGLRDLSAEDSGPASVRTSATAPLPLEQPRTDTER
jgi:hypothetical protein